MKIRITRGIYGFRENGNVVEKTSGDPPFEVSDKEGNRLISLHVAKVVDAMDKTAETSADKETEADGDTSSETEPVSKEDMLNHMSKDDLCRLAEEFGIKKSGSKTELVERLMQCPVWDEQTMDEDEIPELEAEDPE